MRYRRFEQASRHRGGTCFRRALTLSANLRYSLTRLPEPSRHYTRWQTTTLPFFFFWEVKRLSSWRKTEECAQRERKKKSSIPFFLEKASTTPTATIYLTTSHTFAKLGHEVGPQCGKLSRVGGRRLCVTSCPFKPARVLICTGRKRKRNKTKHLLEQICIYRR